MVEAEKIEKLIEEIAEEIKTAKTPEEVEVLERKVKSLKSLIEAIEGDKDLDKVAMLMDKLGPMIEDILGPIKELISELYNPERMAALGKSVAQFYKDLVEAGMDKEAALELTKEYMASINLFKSLIESLAKVVSSKGNIPIGMPKIEIEKEEEEKK
ncbi:hypothetical protein [Pyrococcus woesei]|uniref:hypothetical protein n=1 Tax=Pyrococcus woesei TaxID=2262 RepID=UPI003D2EE584